MRVPSTSDFIYHMLILPLAVALNAVTYTNRVTCCLKLFTRLAAAPWLTYFLDVGLIEINLFFAVGNTSRDCMVRVSDGVLVFGRVGEYRGTH